MKTLIFLVLISLLPVSNSLAKNRLPRKPTAHTVLDELIKRYDPHNRWQQAQMSYTVNIIDQNGQFCTAEIETWGPDEFFQISIKSKGQKIVKRYEYGEYFTSIDHNTEFSISSKNEFGLSEEKIDQCMDLFQLINGSIMEMDRSGMKIKSGLKVTDFEDRNCYALTFTNSSKTTDNSFCSGKIKLYVDRITYDIVGLELKGSPDADYSKLVFDCFHRNSGIIVPQFIKAYNKQGTLIYTKIIRIPTSEYEGIAYHK
ncbi:hypothetical protein ACFLU5_05610 [Bacteroidota bacterium]